MVDALLPESPGWDRTLNLVRSQRSSERRVYVLRHNDKGLVCAIRDLLTYGGG